VHAQKDECYLVIEAIHLCNLAALVVSPQQCDVRRVPNRFRKLSGFVNYLLLIGCRVRRYAAQLASLPSFQQQQICEHLQAIVPPIHEVTLCHKFSLGPHRVEAGHWARCVTKRGGLLP
jgi:hypothetical protein